MRAPRGVLSPWFVVAAVIFAAGSLFHIGRIFFPKPSDPTPDWRHALFAVIDAAVAVGLIRRPPWFVWVFLPLTIHQLGSHGSAAWLLWSEHRGIDMISIGVIVIMPLVLGLLFWDRRIRSR
jgi:hypothetical protein